MTRVLFLLPAYNEAKVLPWSISTLAKFLHDNMMSYDWEIMVVDNASTDDSRAVVQHLQAQEPRLKYFRLDAKGRGRALRTVWGQQAYDVSLYQDVDLAVDLKAIPPIIEAITSGRADVATGSRYAPGAKVQRTFLRSLTSVGYNLLTKMIIRLRTRDAQCGFKAVSQQAAQRILPLTVENNWIFDTELLAWAERLGLRVREIPVEWVETRTATRQSTVNLRKIFKDFVGPVWRLRGRLAAGPRA